MKKYFIHMFVSMVIGILLGIVLKEDISHTCALVLASTALFVACGADKDND